MFVCSLIAVKANFSSKLPVANRASEFGLSDDGPLAIAFLCLRFLSASQILFTSNLEAPLLMRQRHFVRS